MIKAVFVQPVIVIVRNVSERVKINVLNVSQVLFCRVRFVKVSV